MNRKLIGAAALSLAWTSAALAQGWQPSKPVEFIVTAGAGGGTDIFARTVQAAIQKNNLMSQPVIVSIKGGGSGAEGYVYLKGSEGDPHKLLFGTHNLYALPLGAKVAFNHTDFTPIAAMVFDEFMLWVKADSPIKTAKDWAEAVKAKGGQWKAAGALSKDSDELITKILEKEIGTKMIYIPFKSGGETDVQLTGGHVDSHVNNPSESIGSWKAGTARPLCVFNREQLPKGPKVTASEAWSDVPTCVSQGMKLDLFQMPRTTALPGKVPAEAVAFYQALMKRVSETPEWKDYLERTSQTGRVMLGDDLKKFIADDHTRMKGIFEEQNWLVK
jgi:putative tricarboxylic transport membrane protein